MAKKVENEDIRINKFISESGFCSRREADQLIADERVTINGELATLGSRVAEGDKVKIDGESLQFIPMELREYKLRRYGSSRRAAQEEGGAEEKRTPVRQALRERQPEGRQARPSAENRRGEARRERGEERKRSVTIDKSKAARGKAAGGNITGVKSAGRGKSPAVTKPQSSGRRKK